MIKKSLSILIVIVVFVSMFVPASFADYDPDYPYIDSVSLELGGKIGLNFYVYLPQSVIDDTDSYIVFYAGSSFDDHAYVRPVADAPEAEGLQGRTCRKFTYYYYAKELTDNIIISVYYGDGTCAKINGSSPGIIYSVQTYIQNGIDYSTTYKSDPYGYFANLGQAIKDYCAAAKFYFDYKTENASYSESFAAAVCDLSAYAVVKEGSKPEGISETFVSLTLEADNSINVDFVLDNGAAIGDYSFAIDGNIVAAAQNGDNKARIRLKNIPAKELDVAHVFSATKGEQTLSYTMSALSYAYLCQNKNERSSNLAKALYIYNQASKDYFGRYVSPRTGRTYRETDYLGSDIELESINAILDFFVSDEMSTLEKIIAVHDWEVANIKYLEDLSQINDWEYQYPASALIDGETVCAGYAKLFYEFMAELGIPCMYITGEATNNSRGTPENHAWNAVQLDDGKWYYVDVTWDDPQLNGTSDYNDLQNLGYDYLCITEAQIGKDHTAGSDVTLPSPAGTSMDYNAQAISIRQSILLNEIDNDGDNATLALFDAGDADECDAVIAAMKAVIDAKIGENSVTLTFYIRVGDTAASDFYSQVDAELPNYFMTVNGISGCGAGASVKTTSFLVCYTYTLTKTET